MQSQVEVTATPVVEVNAPVEVAKPEVAADKSQVQIKGATKNVQSARLRARVDAENEAKTFIYHKESTNRLDAVNSIGCKGLGQDCNGQLQIMCPNWRTDRACQDRFFTRYMERRYGSWEAAKAHWLARVPINGKDVGHWW